MPQTHPADSASCSRANADQAGAVDFVSAALHAFPSNQTVIVACTLAMSPIILFNRENGLRAGGLGALNVTLEYYNTHLDEPLVMNLGGAIGAYFDSGTLVSLAAFILACVCRYIYSTDIGTVF